MSTTATTTAPSTAHEEEDAAEYRIGGYHPVRIGDTFAQGRYTVVRKLGWGHFSTVWLARDGRTQPQRHVALKVVKSADRYTETALDEVRLCARTQSAASRGGGKEHVVSLLDHFMHAGPHGNHVCMVFEVLGESLLQVVRRAPYPTTGVPLSLVKQLARQMLTGLAFLHDKCGIIHTDLKPENVLVSIDDVETVIQTELAVNSDPPTMTVMGVPPSDGRGGNHTPRGESVRCSPSLFTSSGSAPSMSGTNLDRWSFAMSQLNVDGKTHKTDTSEKKISLLTQGLLEQRAKSDVQADAPQALPQPQTKQAAAKEPPQAQPQTKKVEKVEKEPQQLALIDTDAPPAQEDITVKIADLGNATWIERHFTEDIQTRQYRAPEVILGCEWGPTADVWSAACIIFELATGGDYLFDPTQGQRFTRDDDHLAMMIELLGAIPRRIALGGRYSHRFFHRSGELKHIARLRVWPLVEVLKEKYGMGEAEAKSMAGFLNPMLNLDPRKRTSAAEMLRHPWLADSAATP
ncbi:kinase-like protein [Auriculariales sp. MPI-PUGE-AT-0066]|nr:kinase-like protein [Auriculariales sp. MPI-PUGE-AT-0066]